MATPGISANTRSQKRQGTDSPLKPSYGHFDFDFPASGTVKEYIPVIFFILIIYLAALNLSGSVWA